MGVSVACIYKGEKDHVVQTFALCPGSGGLNRHRVWSIRLSARGTSAYIKTDRHLYRAVVRDEQIRNGYDRK